MIDPINEERVVLKYDFIERESMLGYRISFDDNPNVYIPKSISQLDNKNTTIEVPLWLAEAEGIEMYED